MGQTVQNNASGIGNDNRLLSGQSTLQCPPASYVTGTLGQSGGWSDRISGVTCKNVYTGATSTVTNGGFGGSGGKSSTNPITCNTGASEAIASELNWKSQGALEQLQEICRPLTGGSGRTVGTTATATAR